MARNLRDRGYSSSMDGMRLPKVQERHSRQKTVAPGEASVSKGRKVTPETRSTPSYGSVPEYAQTAPETLPTTPNQSLALGYTDPLDELNHEKRVEAPFRQYINSQRDASVADMSTDEIMKRLRELEAALSYNYNIQNVDYKKTVNRPSYFTNADEEMQDMAQDELLTSAIRRDEASIDQLYWEYNNLKNEYNVRLAQYLQGLR